MKVYYNGKAYELIKNDNELKFTDISNETVKVNLIFKRDLKANEKVLEAMKSFWSNAFY